MSVSVYVSVSVWGCLHHLRRLWLEAGCHVCAHRRTLKLSAWLKQSYLSVCACAYVQAIAPLLENNHPPPDLCEFFCKVSCCSQSDRIGPLLNNF